MLLIRTVKMYDLENLYDISKDLGQGFTSLPQDKTLIKNKIQFSEASFKKEIDSPRKELYFFVLEDTKTKKIVGTSAIKSSLNEDEIFHYEIKSECNQYDKFNIRVENEYLQLSQKYLNCSELCSLYLDANYREGYVGRCLSFMRFLFIRQNISRFHDVLIAQMRGFINELGQSPFWNWFSRNFFHLEYNDVVHLTGIGENDFIGSLVPKHPIYVNVLPKEVYSVIGRVNVDTIPAIKLLQKLGFSFNYCIDLFDAGPTIEAKIDDLNLMDNIRVFQVKLLSNNELLLRLSKKNFIIANHECVDFKATLGQYTVDEVNDYVYLPYDVIELLGLKEGDTVSLLNLALS